MLQNFPQGYPKMLNRMVYSSTPDAGIAISILGPVSASVPVVNGTIALVNVSTAYPFSDTVNVNILGAPLGTPFYIRIPSWATKATLSVTWGPSSILESPIDVGGFNGTMYKLPLNLPASPVTITLATNPSIRISRWFNGSVAVHRGALLYSLQLPENITVLDKHPFDSQDWQVSSPAGTPWNMALVISDFSVPEISLKYEALGAPGDVPFAPASLTSRITAKARQVHAWGMELGAAGPLPASPVCGAPGSCGDLVDVTLVPHGTTLLRISEFPYTAA